MLEDKEILAFKLVARSEKLFDKSLLQEIQPTIEEKEGPINRSDKDTSGDS